METKQSVADETQALRRCVRELTAMSTLSAVWSRSDVQEIAEGLCRVLCRSLSAVFVYVRAASECQTVIAEVAGTQRGLFPANQTQEIQKTLEPLLKSASLEPTPTINNPFGTGTLRLAIIPLGCAGDCGVLVAGSQQPDFPNHTDRLLLGVATNQAATVLHQKRAEQQVRRSERDLSDFFHNATVGLHWVGPDGTILRANKSELDLLGYAADEYIGHHIAEFHADQNAIEDILQRLSAGEHMRDYEARMRCKDGSIKYVLIDSSVLWEDGKFIHTRCFTRDITDRKAVEGQLATELAATRRLQQVSAELLHEDDLEALYHKVLDAAVDIMGSDCGSLQALCEAKRELLLLAHRGFAPASAEAWKWVRTDTPCICGEALRTSQRVIVPDFETCRFVVGTPQLEAYRGAGIRAAQSTLLRSRSGRILGMISTHWRKPHEPSERDLRLIDVLARQAADLIERKQAEDALQKQTERLRLLWEAAAVLLTANNPDAMLRDLLGKIGPHLGVDAYFNFLVNDSGDALRLGSCEGIPVELARALTRVEFGQAVCGTVALHRQPIVATHIQRSDDPKVQLVKSFGVRSYACNPLLAGTRLLGTLSFASRSRDEFDRDEVAFMETICHYVTVAYERLRLLNELTDADCRKDEFLATLAHELRNPLAPIRNAVRMLRLKGPDEPDLRWGREVIDRQVEHLTRLIDDLLDISRITRNKLELRKQRVELAEIITGAVESSRPAIEQCGHELTVTLPPQPIYLHGDLVRLAQVFLNLLTNAAKYTDRGGHIWLTAEQQGSDVVVRVKDTGVGIPAEKLPRLFEMFFQVERTLEKSQGGLGIGLSLVRRLVELHDGNVEARSRGVGKGSEFIVRLPVLVEAPMQTPALDSSDNGAAKATALRILVVDDNRDSADSLAMLLRLTGHEVHTAYDGVQGVQTAEQFMHDVVLLDIGMPKLNGYDACRRIRNEAWGKSMVLIAMTGWGQEEHRRRTEEAGFDAHLVKPVDPTALLNLLASLTAKECQPLDERQEVAYPIRVFGASAT